MKAVAKAAHNALVRAALRKNKWSPEERRDFGRAVGALERLHGKKLDKSAVDAKFERAKRRRATEARRVKKEPPVPSVPRRRRA